MKQSMTYRILKIPFIIIYSTLINNYGTKILGVNVTDLLDFNK